ncbi:hypothetical protein [Mycolicibacterium fortuitum]|uniref:hypothetical protein n=1 Tax=Mycolicibacterium fortuitum TaxID=1766 RepID=UPI00096FFA3D|nr:hypothetical protein [Mycolicibacterium fortuitum]OMC09226.1 hypothetical protein A5734_01680 [Mycolicibacterium fortuitum]
MIHRDRITIHFKRDDGEDAEQVVYGTVVTEQSAGTLEPFGQGLVYKNVYRLILPASLDMDAVGGKGMVSFGDRTARLETAITPSYVHGRIHHYEAIVKAS